MKNTRRKCYQLNVLDLVLYILVYDIQNISMLKPNNED